MKEVELTKEHALDNIYRGFREEVTETYAQTGKVDMPALAVIPDHRKSRKEPFTVFPLMDIYMGIDANGKMKVDSEQLRACHKLAKKLNSTVAMFIAATPAKTESEFGLRDALLLAAKQDSGETVINLWLKGLEGQDGVLTESVGHGAESWTKAPRETTLETVIGIQMVDSLWKEYILVSQVEPMFEEANNAQEEAIQD